MVAATNRNLKARVAERQFRDDLYFRLSVFPVQIPPLRERPGDVVILARHFVERFSRDVNKRPLMLSHAAVEELRAYGWPGNVRELQNCIERAVILAEGDTIQPRHLNLSFRQPRRGRPAAPRSGSGSAPRDADQPVGSDRPVGHHGRRAAARDGGSRAPQDRTGDEGRARQPDGARPTRCRWA